MRLLTGLTFEQRQQLALKSFRHTAEYDSIIQSVLAQRFGEEELPSSLHFDWYWQSAIKIR